MATQKNPRLLFIAASWAALLLGGAAYLIGLWNAQMLLNEKGYYFTLLLFGLFASVSLQKSVRDRADGIQVTGLYYAICWFSLIVALVLLTIGLINATLLLSEKGLLCNGLCVEPVRCGCRAEEHPRCDRDQ